MYTVQLLKLEWFELLTLVFRLLLSLLMISYYMYSHSFFNFYTKLCHFDVWTFQNIDTVVKSEYLKFDWIMYCNTGNCLFSLRVWMGECERCTGSGHKYVTKLEFTIEIHVIQHFFLICMLNMKTCQRSKNKFRLNRRNMFYRLCTS